ADEVDEQLQLFLACVTADVYRRLRSILVDHVGFAAEEMIDHTIDCLLVARNDARRKHDGVAGLDLGVLMVVDGRSRKRGHRFALRAADHHANLLRRIVLDLLRVNEGVRGKIDVSEVLGNLRRFGHRSSNQCNLPVVLMSQFQRELDAVDRRREAGDEQPLLGALEDVVKSRTNCAFTGRIAGTLHIRRVLEQCQHTFLAVFGEGVEVEELVVGRRRIDLEVARMNNHAQRSMDGERDTIDKGVRYLDRMDGEGADLDSIARPHLIKLSIVQQAMFFKLAFYQCESELGPVYRNIQLGKQPGDATDVVFMTVGENHRPNFVPVLNQIGQIRNNDVDPK